MSELDQPRPADRFFTEEEYAHRSEAVRSAMRSRDLAALLIASPEHIYYLVGLSHQGYFAFTLLLFPAEGPPAIITRSMERVTVMDHAPDVDIFGFDDGESPVQAVMQALRSRGLHRSRLGVETRAMFFPIAIWEELRTGCTEATLEDATDVVRDVQLVKSARELACIREAAALSDRAVRAGITTAGVGINEREIAAAVYRSMVLGGSEYPGFAPLMRSTDILGQEHSTWRDRTLTPGDALLLELSASVRRYHAPLTRVVHVGRSSPDVEAAADICLDGLDAVLDALRPGALSGDVYAAWQRAVDHHLGAGRYQRHHCGYSVGIGFPPSWVGGGNVVGLRRDGTLEIREGMVFHVLSWLLDAGPADFGISDTVLVTADGGEILTSTGRRPVVIA